MFASTGESLLKAILATPADNLPRLVYADWLEEEGSEELANFIRLQCEMWRMPNVVNTAGLIADRYVKLQKQSRQLILTHGEKWVKHATPTDTVSHTFDLSDVLHWTVNTIDWPVEDNYFQTPLWRNDIERSRLNKSGIAFTRGFPSHWRGKCLDWFTKVGRSAVQNYPIERVEFCDAFEVFRGRTLRINFDLFDRYPSINGSRREVEIESVAALQNEFSRLAISAVS